MARANNTGKHKSMSYTRFGYIFIAPFVVVYCVFSLLPLLTTFWYSTTNSQLSTANFWGFGNNDIYYDRYLDLNKYYSNDVTQIGLEQDKYNAIKKFFKLQDYVDEYDPLNEEGVKAVIDLGANNYISQGTLDLLQQALDQQNLGLVTADAAKELKTWADNNSDLSSFIQTRLKTIVGNVKSAIEVEESESEGATEEDAVTAESIYTSDDYNKFIETLTANEFSDDQKALINYLASQIEGCDTLVDYFKSVQSGEHTIDEPTFFYVCTNLNAPNAIGADGETAVEKIAVPFISSVQDYLKANVWNGSVTALNTYADFDAYAVGEKDLHDNEESFYADLESLHKMGIINIVKLNVKDGTCEPSTALNDKDSILPAYKSFIDNHVEVNPEQNLARTKIGHIVTYINDTNRKGIKDDAGVEVDQYLTFKGSFDTDRYYKFKEAVAFATPLDSAKYKDIEKSRQDADVAEAKADLEAQNAALPGAKAEYEAAIGTDGEQAAKEKLATVEQKIFKDKQTIAYPDSLLDKTDATKQYAFIGGENFAKIFTHKNTFNEVVGAFWTTAIVWVIGFIPQILLALLLSAWFTDTKLKLKGLNLMKALMYLPNVITAVSVAIFFQKIFSYNTNPEAYSPIQRIIVFFGGEPFNFFRSVWGTRLIVCFINFWMWYGNTMIVLIAGITSISESLYESAQIDGANSFQTYTKITMPLLRPILLYTMVTSMIGGLQMFDIPANLNNNPVRTNFGGTQISSIQTVLMYINKQAFGRSNKNHVGVAAAASVVLFVVTIALSVLIFYLMRDKDAAKAKKRMKKGGTK